MLAAMRSACTVLFATSGEDLEKFLFQRGTYQDIPWHERKPSTVSHTWSLWAVRWLAQRKWDLYML
eukprot:3472141-Amphidinium_carterae.1